MGEGTRSWSEDQRKDDLSRTINVNISKKKREEEEKKKRKKERKNDKRVMNPSMMKVVSLLMHQGRGSANNYSQAKDYRDKYIHMYMSHTNRWLNTKTENKNCIYLSTPKIFCINI